MIHVLIHHWDFAWLTKFINLIIDVIAQIRDVILISPEIKQIKDRSRRRFNNNFGRLRSRRHNLHLDILRERGNPCSMTSLNDEQIIIAVDGRKSRLLTEKPLYCRIDGAG